VKCAQMPVFTWYNKYSVNNEELDNHHKALLKIFNRLFETCLNAENSNCIVPIIDELISYSNYHFSAEVQHMVDTGYKDIDKHILMHRYFSEKALEMQLAENKNDPELIKELIVFLGNWLRKHVLEEDMKYKIPF
jgi:hemerythrin